MRVPRPLFMSLLPVTMFVSRGPAFLTFLFVRALGVSTLLLQGGTRKESIEDIAAEWRRMFPDRFDMPVTGVRDGTAYAEIHEKCPHRGTGRVLECYRAMEYDRRMLETIGGQLVVLRSQAEPGRTHCELAIRPVGAPLDDLVHAHERAPG